MQIAIVSRTGPVLDAYQRFFEAHGIELIHQNSIAELFQQLPETVISGVVIDIQAVLRADEKEKNRLQTLEEVFPNVRTNWNPEMGFRALYNDSAKSGEDNMAAFLEDCRNFKPRALRKDRRLDMNFNVLFWPIDAFAETAQRAYSLNVSYGGLFVCTCYAPRRPLRLGPASGGGRETLQGPGQMDAGLGDRDARPGIRGQLCRDGDLPRCKTGSRPQVGTAEDVG
jgi:hypothetical protein